MTAIRKTTVRPAGVIVLDQGRHLAAGLPEERCVLTEEVRDRLPAGTVTIGADDCIALAVGDGTFKDTGLEGTFPAADSVFLPAYIVAGPGLPVLLPGGTTVASQAEADAIEYDFTAVDATGALLDWRVDDRGQHGHWEAAGQTGAAAADFPVTAWI